MLEINGPGIIGLIERTGGSIRRHLMLYSALTVAAGLTAGQYYQGIFLRHFIPFGLFIMLFPAFLDTDIIDVLRNFFADRKLLIMAMTVNFLVSPLLMYGLLKIFPAVQVPELMTGLLIFSLIPGGGMGPAYTGMINGNVGLSIIITALGLMLSIIFMPLWTVILAGKAVQVPVTVIIKYLFMIIVIPALAAAFTRKWVIYFSGKAQFESIKCLFRNSTGIGLLFLVFIIFTINSRTVINNYHMVRNILLPSFSFSLILLAGSSCIAMVCRWEYRDAAGFIISVTLKNTAVSMALAAGIFHDLTALAITIAGPLIQLPVMVSYIKIRYMISAINLSGEFGYGNNSNNEQES